MPRWLRELSGSSGILRSLGSCGKDGLTAVLAPASRTNSLHQTSAFFHGTLGRGIRHGHRRDAQQTRTRAALVYRPLQALLSDLVNEITTRMPARLLDRDH
jgi:hypothetical protein